MEIVRLKGQIEQLLEQEDLKWQQRAKLAWYQKGDRNTSYFHAWASQRRRNNRIGRITDETGREWIDMANVHTTFIQYYQHLFTTGGVDAMDDCLAGVEEKVDFWPPSQQLRWGQH